MHTPHSCACAWHYNGFFYIAVAVEAISNASRARAFPKPEAGGKLADVTQNEEKKNVLKNVFSWLVRLGFPLRWVSLALYVHIHTPK
jgi:hypothetical protein